MPDNCLPNMQRFGTHTSHTRVYVLANVTAREISRMRGLVTERRGEGRYGRVQTAIYRYQYQVTKRCRLSWLTNSALVYAQMWGEGVVAGPQPMSTAVHMETK